MLKYFRFFGIGVIVIALLYVTCDTFSDFVDGSVILSTIAEGFVVSSTYAVALLTAVIIVTVPLLYPVRYFILFGIGIIVLMLLFIACKKLLAVISAFVAACKKLPTAISAFVTACKKTVAIVITFVIATVLLFAIYNNDVEFTRTTKVRTCGLQYNDDSWCSEKVLVKNIGRNKPNDAEQSKIMIAYFDSVGLSIDYLSSEMPEIKHYSMSFYKSTYATRRHFLEKKKVSTYNGNKTYLGNIHVGRCKDDSTKWKVDISRNLGTADDFDKQGSATKDELLYNECKPYWYENPDWYEANKDNELVKYYMGLRR